MVSKQAVALSAAQGLMIVAAAVLAFAIAISPAPALAAVDCTAASTGDSDGDGFSDVDECNGLTLTAALGGGSFPRCTTATTDRSTCVDPNTKDVFIIVVPAATSFLPSNLLQLLSGLPVGVHVITQTTAQVLLNPDRTVSVNGTQKAIRLSESLDTNGSTAGQCTWGTPNDAAECVVFTRRIVNFVNSTFATCTPGATLATIQSIITTYIQQVAVHEPSHSMKLTKIYDIKYGGHHYAPGTNAMMAQNNTYSCKGGKLTWTIGTPFTAADVGDFLLK